MDKKRKLRFSRPVELLAFLILFIFISVNLMNLLMVKGRYIGPRLYNVYEGNAKNTDVLIVGSSHAIQLTGRELWRDKGIATFTVGGNSQPVDIVYHSIVEFLKYENPKVVMVETALIPDDSLTDPDMEYTGRIQNDAPFRFSFNYVKMALEQIKNFELPIKKDGIELLYKWPLMHDRYKSLTKDDFVNEMPYLNTDTDPLFSVPDEELQIVTTDERAEMSSVGYEYLDRIIKLCKKKNIELILFHTPYPASELVMAQQNTISDIAAENDVPFLDFNYLIDEAGLDLQADMAADKNHLNYYGAKKVTSYLGDYLVNNYGLEDHRQDLGYENWDKDLEAWRDITLRSDLTGSGDIEGWSEKLSENYADYVLIITLSGNYKVEQEGVIKSFLEKVSAPEDFYEKGGCLILDHGNVVFTSQDEIYTYSHEFENTAVSVNGYAPVEYNAQEALEKGVDDKVYIWGEDYIKIKNGINVTIYNDRLDLVVDSVGLNVYESNSELVR